jgi:hypothetical protein
MTLSASAQYPPQNFYVEPFPENLVRIFPLPPGFVEYTWPPIQLVYLGFYLTKLGCKTIVTESHYIDRDYIHEHSAFYSRSLRGYPNYCQRIHFFNAPFGEQEWRAFVTDVDHRVQSAKSLQDSYLGFIVVRPLPGSPIGRSVLVTYGNKTDSGLTRSFGPVRDYPVHLGGFDLTVRGLPFQQQDQGVSACATIALWSAIHNTAAKENLYVPTPAQITQAASRYVLSSGRSFPSEGLNLSQMCEGVRGAGLEPLVIHSVSVESDRFQLLSYLNSGLAPVLGIRSIDGGDGHAVCAVGLKLGNIAPQTDPDFHYLDAGSAVRAVYIHDDRLGPYASAEIGPWTLGNGHIATGLLIRWPDKDIMNEQSVLLWMLVPMPAKARVPISRMRILGLNLAQAAGELFPEFSKRITFDCSYRFASQYRRSATQLGLSAAGLYGLNCEIVLSRYVGVIELSIPEGPLFDVLLDATETRANPSAVAFVVRTEFPKKYVAQLGLVAKNTGARMFI